MTPSERPKAAVMTAFSQLAESNLPPASLARAVHVLGRFQAILLKFGDGLTKPQINHVSQRFKGMLDQIVDYADLESDRKDASRLRVTAVIDSLKAEYLLFLSLGEERAV